MTKLFGNKYNFGRDSIIIFKYILIRTRHYNLGNHTEKLKKMVQYFTTKNLIKPSVFLEFMEIYELNITKIREKLEQEKEELERRRNYAIEECNNSEEQHQ